MKKRLTLMLAAALALSLAACGGRNSAAGGSSNSGSPQQSGGGGITQQEPETADFSWDNVKARLIYAEGSYLAVVTNIPSSQKFSAKFSKKDGSSLETGDVGYGYYSPARTLITVYEIEEEIAVSDLQLEIHDHSIDKTVTIQDFGERMTNSELEEIGFTILNGHPCLMTEGTKHTASDGFGMMFNLIRYDETHDLELSEAGIDKDGFLYYAGDGTPLTEYFKDFDTIEVTAGKPGIYDHVTFYVLLHASSGNYSKSQYAELCDELKACQPYVTYTNTDGTTKQFQLFQE